MSIQWKRQIMSYEYESSLDLVYPMRRFYWSNVSKAQFLSRHCPAQKDSSWLPLPTGNFFKKSNFSTLRLNFIWSYINSSFHSICFFMQTGSIALAIAINLESLWFLSTNHTISFAWVSHFLSYSLYTGLAFLQGPTQMSFKWIL